MRFYQAAEKLSWKLRNIPIHWEIGPPCIDSRKSSPGEVFWALKGKRDGGQFALEALIQGAQAAVVDPTWADRIPPDKPLVIVEDTLKALTDLAKLVRDNFQGRVFALTGSCGKTTTKELIAWVLSQKYRVLKNPGSFNNHIGLPFTLSQLNDKWDIAVLEVGANHPGEIAQLCQIAQPTAGMITMIGRAHLQGFGSLKGVVEAKGELFRSLTGDKIAFVNFQDPYVVAQSQTVGNRIGYGFRYTSLGPKLQRYYQGKMTGESKLEVLNTEFEFPFPRFMSIHALGAIAIAHYWGVSIPEMVEAVRTFSGVEGRMKRIQLSGITVYDDTYNSNPSSLKAALEFLSSIKTGKRIAVLGDMLELGKFARIEHQNAIKLCQELKIDQWFTSGEIFTKIKSSNNFTDVEKLVDQLSYSTKRGDTILFKGSRMMKMEEILTQFKNRLTED